MEEAINNRSFLEVAIWVGVVILAVLAMAGVMVYTRRRTLQEESSALPTLSLQSLREWRDCGEISIAEYERLRAKLLHQMKGKEITGGGNQGTKGPGFASNDARRAAESQDVTNPMDNAPSSSLHGEDVDNRNGAGGIDSQDNIG